MVDLKFGSTSILGEQDGQQDEVGRTGRQDAIPFYLKVCQLPRTLSHGGTRLFKAIQLWWRVATAPLASEQSSAASNAHAYHAPPPPTAYYAPP